MTVTKYDEKVLLRELCTEAERERMSATVSTADHEHLRSHPEGVNVDITVEHPSDLHGAFVRKAVLDGSIMLASIDLGDGWYRVTYRQRISGE